MSVANYPFQDIRFVASSGNNPVAFGAAGAPLDSALVLTPPLIVNSDATETTITLQPGIYDVFSQSFVNINDNQTACQSMQLCLYTVVGGVLAADPLVKGQNYTAFGSSPLVPGDILNMSTVQILLQAQFSYLVVAATTSIVARIRYTGMPAALASSANFTSVQFNKISDNINLPVISFKY